MRNEESARYARWAAVIAAFIAATAGIFYFSREIRQAHARKHGPKAVPATVEQQSAEFSFSKVEKDRTIYTVQASRATQFAGENSSLLEDVTITFFGNEGDRHDVLRTHECDYDRISGGIRCQGSVEIDIQAAASVTESGANGGGKAGAQGNGGNADKPATVPRTLVVITSDVAFDRETGVATTKQPVKFGLPNGDGHAIGVNYNSKAGTLKLEREVEMQVRDEKNPTAPPVVFTGASFDYNRDEHVAKLEGAARAVQGNRQITAQTLVVELDQQLHAKHGFAEGNPEIQMHDEEETVTGNADRFDAALNEAGWVANLRATKNVRFEKKAGDTVQKLSAQNADMQMEPKINQPREMQASGNVKLETSGPSGSDRVDTAQLHAFFVPSPRPPQRRLQEVDFPVQTQANLSGKDGITTVKTRRGKAEFDALNHMQSFEGDSGVEIIRQPLTGEQQRTTAQHMTASFDGGGKWDTVNLDQKVHFVQADRRADAQHAQIVNATNTIVLTGNASISDASSHTAGEKFEIQQQTGEVSGAGGIRTEVVNNPPGPQTSQSREPGFISADRVDGSTAKGHLIYTGHARLWQGEAVLDANRIELWREDQQLDAQGNVVAVFPQAPGQASGKTGGQSSGKVAASKQAESKQAAPVLWKIEAPRLQYWNIEGRAHLDGGVFAHSQDQSLNSQTLDVFLSPAAPPPHTMKPEPPGTNGAFPGLGSREITRAVATGSVVVKQVDRRGTGERAEYTAADQRFVLSGGSPTFTDAADETITAGRSLTFYRASDTVSVDSETGSRTLTKHRVEK
jgi:lipopolysaccharide export system protein LptA